MPTETPTLSIITINRNNAEGLRKTMESVLTQSCNDFEYIVIDGASTDNSVEVIKDFLEVPEYASKISYWVSEPDKGLYNALNKGIKKANGELVGLMHSGDWYFNEVFEKVIETFNQNSTSILYGPLMAVVNGKFDSIWGSPYTLLPKQMIPHLSTFVPKQVYDTIGYFDETYKIAGDYDLFLKFYTQKVPFVFINSVICCFNLEGISQTNKLVLTETNQVKKKYGFYIPETRKEKLKKIIKRIIHW